MFAPLLSVFPLAVQGLFVYLIFKIAMRIIKKRFPNFHGELSDQTGEIEAYIDWTFYLTLIGIAVGVVAAYLNWNASMFAGIPLMLGGVFKFIQSCLQKDAHYRYYFWVVFGAFWLALGYHSPELPELTLSFWGILSILGYALQLIGSSFVAAFYVVILTIVGFVLRGKRVGKKKIQIER